MSKLEGQVGTSLSPAPSDGVIADSQPPDVGSNLRRLRRLKGYSLETLARRSGVSRAMLGQIETGKSVPTITLVWKIARALGLPASVLIASATRIRTAVVRRARMRAIETPAGKYSVLPFVVPEFTLPFEFTEVRVASRHREQIAPHVPGSRAALLVVAGLLEVALDGEEPETLHEGDVVLFEAGSAHSISNPGMVDAVAYLVIAPTRNGMT